MKKLFLACASLMLMYSCNTTGKEHTDTNVAAYNNPIVAPLTEAIQSDSENAALYFERGQALVKVNARELAIKDYREAMKLNNKNVNYQEALAFLLMEEDNNEAVTILEKIAYKNPSDVMAKFNVSNAYIHFNQLDNADKILKPLLQEHPEHPLVWYYNGQLEAAKKDTATAINYMEKALLIVPDLYEANVALADYQSARDIDKAIMMYQKTFNLDTLNVKPLYAIGKMYETKGKLQEAKLAYRNVVLHDRDFETSYISMARLLIQEDSLDKAQRQLNIVFDIAPNNAEAYYYSGLIAEKQKQTDKAKQHYQKALVFNPKYEAAKSALDKLQ